MPGINLTQIAKKRIALLKNDLRVEYKRFTSDQLIDVVISSYEPLASGTAKPVPLLGVGRAAIGSGPVPKGGTEWPV
jgi:hypothetical protein